MLSRLVFSILLSLVAMGLAATLLTIITAFVKLIVNVVYWAVWQPWWVQALIVWLIGALYVFGWLA